MAHQFGCPDPDALMDRMSAEQFNEWCDYFAVEPQGWQGMQLVTQRLGYLIAQSRTSAKLKEKDFAIELIQTNTEHAAKFQEIRAEAEMIKANILAEIEGGHVHSDA